MIQYHIKKQQINYPTEACFRALILTNRTMHLYLTYPNFLQFKLFFIIQIINFQINFFLKKKLHILKLSEFPPESYVNNLYTSHFHHSRNNT